MSQIASTKNIAHERKEPAAQTDLRMGRAQTESGLVWVTTVFMVIFHVGTIAALFFFSWTNLIVAIVLYVFAINLRHRHGLSSPAGASRLQGAQSGGVFSRHLRHAGP